MQLIHPEKILQTQRLLLEPLKQHHASLLYPILQDPQIYGYVSQNPPISLEILQQRYQKLERRLSPTHDEAWLNWAVCLKSSRQFIGRVEASISPKGSAYFAYMFGSQFWNSGYATEASRQVLQVLVDDYKVAEFIAQVDTRNQASIRLLERLSFEQVEHQTAVDFFKGSFSDEYTYRRVAVS